MGREYEDSIARLQASGVIVHRDLDDLCSSAMQADPRAVAFIRRINTALASRGLCLTADQLDAILKYESEQNNQSNGSER